jgi:chromosomal replication initiation ATPase DnaA
VEQFDAFTTIIDSVVNGESKFYFVSGYGGTGKTFLWNAIVLRLRSEKKIVLTVASSRVASLLPSGRTTHSRFKVPCDIDVTSTCNIKKDIMLAELI